MADDKMKQDNRDRGNVTGEEDYEVAYLAKQANITPERARELIRKYGQ